MTYDVDVSYDTIRYDQFAMAALTGLLANKDHGSGLRIPNPKGLETLSEQLAHWAYQLADAMVAERAAKGGN